MCEGEVDGAAAAGAMRSENTYTIYASSTSRHQAVWSATTTPSSFGNWEGSLFRAPVWFEHLFETGYIASDRVIDLSRAASRELPPPPRGIKNRKAAQPANLSNCILYLGHRNAYIPYSACSQRKSIYSGQKHLECIYKHVLFGRPSLLETHSF